VKWTAQEIATLVQRHQPEVELRGSPLLWVKMLTRHCDAALGTISFWWQDEAVPSVEGVLVTHQDVTPFAPHAVIRCLRPRLAFIKLVEDLPALRNRLRPLRIAATARISGSASIGEEGQGYEWDGEQHLPIPHLAGVNIEGDVHIGPCSTVMRGVLQDTHIGHGSRIGNGVNIGHGAHVGRHCVITAHSTVGGSAHLGDHVTLWQNAMVANRVRIGAGAIIGMGAVVLNDVPSGETWVGNPARRSR
jgi:acetyltransferase-like isoleucine patch superfamily enzyme